MPTGAAVVSVDMLVQDRHFRLDWSSAADIGHKAAAESLSDINAMGGVATALLVGLGCPADVEAGWLLDLADGIAEEAAEVGASVVGGDLTSASTDRHVGDGAGSVRARRRPAQAGPGPGTSWRWPVGRAGRRQGSRCLGAASARRVLVVDAHRQAAAAVSRRLRGALGWGRPR